MSDKIDETQVHYESNKSEESLDSDVIIVNDGDSESNEDGEDSDTGDESHVEECFSLSDDDDEIIWKNPALLRALISAGYRNPRLILTRLFGVPAEILPSDPCEPRLWRILSALLAEQCHRKPLRCYFSLNDAISLLNEKSKILVLTGAGISVSCGIPDFRSRNGVYARLEKDFPDLHNPQDMFDLHFFKSNPNPFYSFAKELFPGQFKPSYTHRFIRLLEKKFKLLRNYTQNIDTLEEIAGISRVIHCHGSFATASCLSCKLKVPGEELREAIMSQHIPFCPKCRPEIGLKGIPTVLGTRNEPESEECKLNPPLGLMKPDIVFFSESLPQEFHFALEKDVADVDLVLVMGSSLKVRPVSHIPNSVPHHVPQILINREPLSTHRFDIELLGDCDEVVEHLCKKLGWDVDEVDANSETVPNEMTSQSDLRQIDLFHPMKAALEDLTRRSDLIGSLASSVIALNSDKPDRKVLEEKTSYTKDKGNNGDISPTHGARGISFNEKNEVSATEGIPESAIEIVDTLKTKEIPTDPKDTNREASASIETHSNVKMETEEIEKHKGQQPLLKGSAESPIDVDETESYYSDFDNDSDDNESSEKNRKTVKLANYLPENTFTRIPKRLYVFKGSELAIAPRMVMEYVRIHAHRFVVGNEDALDVYSNPENYSDPSDDEDSDFVVDVIRRCQRDPLLEAERRRCLGEGDESEVVEVINCDESLSDSVQADIGVTITESAIPNAYTPSTNGAQELRETTASDSSSFGPSEIKRRKINRDEENSEETSTASDSFINEKTVNRN